MAAEGEAESPQQTLHNELRNTGGVTHSSEQAVLARRLRGLTARRPGWAVCLWGEPGIGKTHAVKTLLHGAPLRSLSLPAPLSASGLACALPQPARLAGWAVHTLERLREGQAVPGSADTPGETRALAGLALFVLHLDDLHDLAPEQRRWRG